MEDRTFYKMPDGTTYSVSPRIINLGIPPLEGAIELTEDEKRAVIKDIQFKNELSSRLTAEESSLVLKSAFPERFFQNEIVQITKDKDLTGEEKEEKVRSLRATDEEKTLLAGILQAKAFPSAIVKRVTGIDVPEPEITAQEPEPIPEPELIPPVIQRRIARQQRRLERQIAVLESEHNNFFESLSDEEIPYYENLLNQGLSPAQLFNIKQAKDAKNIGREG